jgi:DNA-binding MarR family transcriptional regulator
MNDKTVQLIEYEIALLVRLTTAHSPRLGSLDRAEYLLLSQLQKSSPIAINALAEQLLLNLSTASRQIAVLEKKGYIKRFPDPINGRISLIELTEKGSNILKKVQDARSSAYTEMLNEWSPNELIQLKDSLTRLNKDFKKWRK